MAISMRLNTRRRTAFATATGLPRCARNDTVGTHETSDQSHGFWIVSAPVDESPAGPQKYRWRQTIWIPAQRRNAGRMRERRNAGRARSKGPAPNHPFILSLSKDHPEPVERFPRARRKITPNPSGAAAHASAGPPLSANVNPAAAGRFPCGSCGGDFRPPGTARGGCPATAGASGSDCAPAPVNMGSAQ